MRVAAADFAFERNSSAFAWGDDDDGIVTIRFVKEWRPQPGKPLRPSTVFGECAALANAAGIDGIMADAHYRQSAIEAFEPWNVSLLEAPADPVGPFLETRLCLVEALIALPDDPRLIDQFGRVKASDGTQGGMRITQERTRDGAHGDLVSAAVLIPWQLRHIRGAGRAFSGRVSRGVMRSH